MGSTARLWALAAACAAQLVLGACAINPQPEPPDQADYSGVGGAGPDAGIPADAQPTYDGGTSGAGGASTGGAGGSSGGVAGSAGTSNGVAPGAFDESYASDDELGARVDKVNETDAGADADSGTDATDSATQD